jgi:hypothetical protein
LLLISAGDLTKGSSLKGCHGFQGHVASRWTAHSSFCSNRMAPTSRMMGICSLSRASRPSPISTPPAPVWRPGASRSRSTATSRGYFTIFAIRRTARVRDTRAAHGGRLTFPVPASQGRSRSRRAYACLRGTPAHRCRMSRQREAADLGQRGAVEAQDVNVAVDEIADIEKAPVGAEDDAFQRGRRLRLGPPCAPSCRRFSAVPRSYPGRGNGVSSNTDGPLEVVSCRLP